MRLAAAGDRTMPAVPPRPPRHRVPIARSYVAELRRRCEAAGLGKVAVAAGIHRNSLRRTLTSAEGRHPTLDTIASVRRALARIEGPDVEPMPEPLVAVKDTEHHRKIRIAEQLPLADLTRIARKKRR